MISNIDLPASQSIDYAHIWRSKFIDMSAKCEGQLRRILEISANSPAQYRQMAKAVLKEVEDKAKPTKQDKQLAKICAELLPLIDLRAEIAHSQLSHFTSDNEHYSGWANAKQSHSHFSKMTLLTKEQQDSAYVKLASIANQLSQLK